MIIDAHYHRVLSVTKQIIENRAKHIFHAAKTMDIDIDWDTIIAASKEWDDPTGEKLIASMDRDGIDITIICKADNMESGDSVEIAQQTNQALGKLAERFPKRLIALAGVDPRRSQSADMLKQCFEEFGVSGLKYHPDHGYAPCSSQSYQLLEIVEKNHGVLLSHTSPLPPPARCELAEPMLLANIGVDFPAIKVIAAHMGGINWRPWASLAYMQPNMYGDLAMWDAFAVGRYRLFRRELRDLIDYVGVSKVLFGTDGPIFSTVFPTRDWIGLLKDLPNHSDGGINFTKAEVDAILGGNASAVFEVSG